MKMLLTLGFKMTRKEFIDKLESVGRKVKEIRKYLSRNDGEQVAPVGFPLPLESSILQIVTYQ